MNAMKTLIVLRHGPIDKNDVQDSTPLNDKGHKFAKDACTSLELEPIDYVVCDSSIRAIQTVTPLLISKNIPYLILPTVAASVPTAIQAQAETVLFCGRWEGIRGLDGVQLRLNGLDRKDFYERIYVFTFVKDREPFEQSRVINLNNEAEHQHPADADKPRG